MYRKQNTTAKYFVLFECAPRQNFLSSYEKKKYLRACNILCKHSGPKYIWGAFANDFKSMFVHPPNPSMSGTQKKGKKMFLTREAFYLYYRKNDGKHRKCRRNQHKFLCYLMNIWHKYDNNGISSETDVSWEFLRASNANETRGRKHHIIERFPYENIFLTSKPFSWIKLLLRIGIIICIILFSFCLET